MNAPLPEHVRRALETTRLDDKYALERGQAFMSGVQALVRLPMLQRKRDELAGHRTAGFVSGYRGSPLGGYDQALWAAASHLKAQHVVFQPGVNEDLAATAVWGTQMLHYAPKAQQKYDGVFGIWYGKGPGVDRSCDVFKHANMAGTSPLGGVIAVAGDDHAAKSSTAAHQSDHIFKACGLPVFFPASVQEILDLGQHAFALSRYSGVWAGMKTIQEIVESSATTTVDPERVNIVIPRFDMPPGGVHIRWPDSPLEQEERLFNYKWYAALAYIRANKLNHNVIQGPHDRLGIITSGKSYNDTRQALQDLGLDDDTCRRIGLRLHKVGVVWPLDAHITRDFATGLREILVVEEKRQVIEYQLKEELYNWRADVRPNVLGKYDELPGDSTGGEWSVANPSANTLLRANNDLNPALIAKAIAKRLRALGGLDADTLARIDARLQVIEAKERAMEHIELKGDRTPWFCSGCPHNTSTTVPAGSRALGGIGCHYMATWMGRGTVGFTQMGGEGVPWVGQAPFTNEPHLFSNLGDGTYFHSGILAIRQSIAAGVNITYKILYNDAVAMTGGQTVGERPEGHSVLQIVNSLKSEGASRIVVVSDTPEKYQGVNLPAGIEVRHRDDFEATQQEFTQVKGTSVIVYDQTCATEKRRRRKRGKMVDPAKRVVINELVCEGCGDCGEVSNCMSVEPLETPFGRKRTINQSTCNKDFSCVKGFCPSFVTVEGGQLKKPQKDKGPDANPLATPLPEPVLPALHQPWGIVVAGVGGTGVITIGQLLGMAAHMEGKGVVTQDAAGLAQKGGNTWSHILIAERQSDIATTRVATASADLILGCDPIVAASKETLMRMQPQRTHVALSGHATPTAAFVHDTDWQNPAQACARNIALALGVQTSDGQNGDEQARWLGLFPADKLAMRFLGDSLYINPMVMGYAWQKGWIPLRLESILRAIELNNVAVESNKTAFAWGRRAAHDPAGVAQLLSAACAPQVIEFKRRETLDEAIARRAEFLVGYQHEAYAQAYRDYVATVREAESRIPGAAQTLPLTLAVAKGLFKLMAYKDEYEVGRLHSGEAFKAKIESMFEGDYQLHFHLAPPLTHPEHAGASVRKKPYGPGTMWLFKLLSKLKGLRGTALDPFGRLPDRKIERALIGEYRASIDQALSCLSGANHATAVELARLPEQIKGYGHVKAASLAKVRPQWAALDQALRHPNAAPAKVA